MATDIRKPREVFAAFCARLAGELAPLGFKATRKGATLTRKSPTGVTHRIELGSSHYNSPGHVACDVSLWATDTRLGPDWRAGGGLTLEPFADEIGTNVASDTQANRLVGHVRERLEFFELVDDPPRLLDEVSRRYVGGLLDPAVVVPYLAARLGTDAVAHYARALLDGRNELWPAFLGAPSSPRGTMPEDGCALARALKAHARGVTLTPPADAVVSKSLTTANQRAFFGLQLRAWGEPEAAAALRRSDDDAVRNLYARSEAVKAPVDAREKFQVVFGTKKRPRRERPSPRYFQYRARHEPFAR